MHLDRNRVRDSGLAQLQSVGKWRWQFFERGCGTLLKSLLGRYERPGGLEYLL